MSEPLDEQYLNWLYARIGSLRETRKSKTYWSLFQMLFTKEFLWTVHNDDNRVEDGKDLRYEFLDETNQSADANWMGEGCSVLELILGLSNRLSFEDDRSPRLWFWELLTNLGLSGYTDTAFDPDIVEAIIDNFVNRNYRADGFGGLFPLRYPQGDQREVELWYQLQQYIQQEH